MERKETEMCSCIIESFRYSASVVDHSTPNTSDLRLYSLSEIRATIILRIANRVSLGILSKDHHSGERTGRDNRRRTADRNRV